MATHSSPYICIYIYIYIYMIALNLLLTRSHNYFTLFTDALRPGQTSCGTGTPKVIIVSQPMFGTNLGSFVSCRGEISFACGTSLKRK